MSALSEETTKTIETNIGIMQNYQKKMIILFGITARAEAHLNAMLIYPNEFSVEAFMVEARKIPEELDELVRITTLLMNQNASTGK